MIYIIKQEGLYQNNSNLVSICNCKMGYKELHREAKSVCCVKLNFGTVLVTLFLLLLAITKFHWRLGQNPLVRLFKQSQSAV